MVTKNYDVIIVGTGAGGGTLAHTRGAWDLRHHAMPVRQHLHERGAKSIRQTLTVQKYTPVPLLMVIALIQFGNPSSGGANGVPFLPAFWRDIGPYLPPRNAYLLLHYTIYFNGRWHRPGADCPVHLPRHGRGDPWRAGLVPIRGYGARRCRRGCGRRRPRRSHTIASGPSGARRRPH